MAKDLGRALVQLILRGVILLAGFSVIYKLIWPRGAFQILFLFLSLILGWVISFTWRFLINLTSFWTPDARGILRFSFVISWFLTGFLMPLRFYPDWIVRIAYLTPFPYMFNTIIEIYLGVVTGQALVESILLQAAWALGLITLGQIVMRSGIRKLVIQGG
jgi:ABC-2 type transport system permease protein